MKVSCQCEGRSESGLTLSDMYNAGLELALFGTEGSSYDDLVYTNSVP